MHATRIPLALLVVILAAVIGAATTGPALAADPAGHPGGDSGGYPAGHPEGHSGGDPGGHHGGPTDVIADPNVCASNPELALLDFWIGDWDVYAQGAKVGEDHVEKILGGCAVRDDWTAASGGHGLGLFYYRPAEKTWKQVWVTERALSRGGVKERVMVERLPDGGVRFQGEVNQKRGQDYLDRITLTPVTPDEIRQDIEISDDGGKSWQKATVAMCTRRK